MTKLMKMLAIIEIKKLAKNFDGNQLCITVYHDDVKIINIQLLLLKIYLSKICLLEIYVKIPITSYTKYFVKAIGNTKSSFT